MQACVAHSKLPGTTPLFADFLYDFPKVAQFYPYNPRDVSAFGRRVAAMRYPDERRARLVEILREQNGDCASVRLLSRSGTCAVVTGQQVGLFSGPAYTIYKALTAIRLAQRLTEQGITAVPVFWLATEDHDWAEVNHCWVFNRDGEPVRLEASGAAAQRIPAGLVAVPATVVEQLRAALEGLPFAEQVCDLIGQAYHAGATFGRAFASLLKELLGRWGLVFLDPLAPEARQLMAPLLAEAVERHLELSSLLVEQASQLISTGYHLQVRLEPGSALMFLLENGQRLSVVRDGDQYLCGTRRFSAQELMERASALSPAALLRPVIQDWMMPVAASVMGPAEIAYWAQSQPLYRALGVAPPVAFPRASWTLLDRRASALIERYQLELADLFKGEQAVRERIAARLAPPELAAAIEQSRTEIGVALERLEEAVAAFDARLWRVLQRSQGKILYQLGKIERKVAREALARDERASQQAHWLCNLLLPGRRLQERRYSLVAFLARYGLDLIERLYEDAAQDCFDHRLIVVD